MADVINYPEPEYILTCKHCRCKVFYIWLGSRDNEDYKQYQCANEECCALYAFSEIEAEIDT